MKIALCMLEDNNTCLPCFLSNHTLVHSMQKFRENYFGTHMQVAVAVAAANWALALQHLLSQAPVTAEDKQLWLHLLPLVDTLLGSHAVQPSALHLLALCMRQAALPMLGNTQAVKGPPSLPLALTNHADAACIFSEAQQQLTDIEVTQVSWLWRHDASMLLSKRVYMHAIAYCFNLQTTFARQETNCNTAMVIGIIEPCNESCATQ